MTADGSSAVKLAAGPDAMTSIALARHLDRTGGDIDRALAVLVRQSGLGACSHVEMGLEER
jgi:hypothetical protein